MSIGATRERATAGGGPAQAGGRPDRTPGRPDRRREAGCTPSSMLARLALAFVLIPLLELVLLIQLGQWVGVWPTVGLVVLTGIVGASLARAEGIRTLRAFQRELGEGRLPGTPLLDGLAILVGGAFLLTPGLLTDVAGFSLLLPPTRRLIRRFVRRRIEAGLEAGTIRVGVAGMGGGGSRARGSRGAEDEVARELDPRNEIRVDASAE